MKKIKLLLLGALILLTGCNTTNQKITVEEREAQYKERLESKMDYVLDYDEKLFAKEVNPKDFAIFEDIILKTLEHENKPIKIAITDTQLDAKSREEFHANALKKVLKYYRDKNGLSYVLLQIDTGLRTELDKEKH